jgi:ubiquinone biosynthesis protein COQ9
MLKPEQIAELMSNIPVNNRAYKIDYSYRMKRNAISNTYFSSAICPHHVDNFEDYKEHDEGIRQQALSGIDSKELVLV